MWVHGSIPGFEPLASGPTSLVNRSRRTIAQLIRDNAEVWLGAGEPPSQDGVSNVDELVGDYTNSILKPDAAEIAKKFGEMSLAKVPFPSPRNQCWPGGVPFVFTSGAIQIAQKPDKIIILYNYDHQVRHVRVNEPHPPRLTPSWYGDSVGHYEGDTLVIDTVGSRLDPLPRWTGTAPRTQRLSTWWSAIGSSIAKPQKMDGNGTQKRISASSRRQTTGATTCSSNSRSRIQVFLPRRGRRP
jgi:hypothetical protein